ncbi:MAG: SPOR domain-containing protein [Bacteroidales bacterium]|jgi:hypothetical protein|nr:SPOR domain-containing protein [Bacteroidales bacterium]
MKKYLLLFILSALAFGGFAQHKGSLRVKQDSRVERLMVRQRDIYAVSNTMSGFRVQIFMEIGNEAVDHANLVKKEFEELYPDLPIYLSYEQPYYRLRVGDFRNRVEAEKYLRILKPQYSLAFVTADIINPPVRIKPTKTEAVQDLGEESGENYQE